LKYRIYGVVLEGKRGEGREGKEERGRKRGEGREGKRG
jgi:hypothetical protein